MLWLTKTAGHQIKGMLHMKPPTSFNTVDYTLYKHNYAE